MEEQIFEFFEPEPQKPSKFFCKTGYLQEGEKYNKNLHNYGITIRIRSHDFYTEEEIIEMETESYKKKPSPFYCKTGYLDIEIGEQFDKELHNLNKISIRDRALGFYSEIEIIDMQIEMKYK